MAFSVPDRIFETFRDVTPEFLLKHSIRCVLCDIDNTLVTYDDAEPTDAVKEWLKTLSDAGIAVVFLSNNTDGRVRTFANAVGNAWYAPAGKPFTKTAKKALRIHGFSASETAVLGDQIFTDVWTGDFLGAKLTLLVPPIKDKKSFFFRTKRILEKPFLATYRRREKRNSKSNTEVSR